MGNFLTALKDVIKNATSRTSGTFASTDLVPLTDSAGNVLYKISKDDLMAAVKASLPALLSDQSTNGTEFPSLASGVLGKMTAANLASVLGVTQCAKMMGSVDGSNVDQKTDVGFYQHPGAIRTGGNWGVLFVYKGAYDYIVQLDYEFSFGAYSVRYSTNRGTTWGSWHQILTDIPSFYKDYNSLSALATGLGNVGSLLKVNSFTVTTQGVNSGYNVNAGNLGRTIIVIDSVQGGAGNATASQILMIRCGYSGNNYSVSTIAKNEGSVVISGTFELGISTNDDGYLIFSSQVSSIHHVLLFSNR